MNENILPSYEVSIESPPFILKDSQFEKIKICAKYTHGSHVKGQANMTLSTKYKKGTWWRAPYVSINVNKVMALENGCAEIKLNSTEIKSLVEKSNPLDIFAEVKELATGEKQNATIKEISVKDTPFKIDAGTSPKDYIITGFPYVGHFRIGKNVKNQTNKMCETRSEERF